MKTELENSQRKVCEKFSAPFVECAYGSKVGISLNVKAGARPINGLRVTPDGGTCGWYIWGGEEWSDDPDFFVPLHLEHLPDWAPLALPYLGLPPGWRFLVTEEYEDVWEDPELLEGQRPK